jgi:ABC-type amino acid transport substrate-binding protein
MSDQIDTTDAPPVPPEVEQAAMLGNEKDAVSLYVKHTGVDPDVARAVVQKLAE